MLLDTVNNLRTLLFMTREMKIARNNKKKLSKLINKNPNRAGYPIKFKATRIKVLALSRKLT